VHFALNKDSVKKLIELGVMDLFNSFTSQTGKQSASNEVI